MMFRDIQFGYFGNNARIVIKIAQIAFSETRDTHGTLNDPFSEDEFKNLQLFSKINIERRYELILDLHGNLDADL